MSRRPCVEGRWVQAQDGLFGDVDAPTARARRRHGRRGAVGRRRRAAASGRAAVDTYAVHGQDSPSSGTDYSSLPTPLQSPADADARDHKGDGQPGTPRHTVDVERHKLEAVVNLLPTPTTEDHGTDAPGRTGGASLSTSWAVANLLPTPSVADSLGGHATRSGDRSDELLLPGLAKAQALGALLPTPAVNDMGAGKTVEAWDAWTAKLEGVARQRQRARPEPEHRGGAAGAGRAVPLGRLRRRRGPMGSPDPSRPRPDRTGAQRRTPPQPPLRRVDARSARRLGHRRPRPQPRPEGAGQRCRPRTGPAAFALLLSDLPVAVAA